MFGVLPGRANERCGAGGPGLGALAVTASVPLIGRRQRSVMASLSVDRPGVSAHQAAAINAAAVTRNYAVKPRLQYQTVGAVSGEPPTVVHSKLTVRASYYPRQCQGIDGCTPASG